MPTSYARSSGFEDVGGYIPADAGSAKFLGDCWKVEMPATGNTIGNRTDSIPAEVDTLVHKALDAFKRQELASAVAYLESALKFPMPSATHADICRLICEWQIKRGHISDARTAAKRLLVFTPTDVRMRLQLPELLETVPKTLGLVELVTQVRRSGSAVDAFSISRLLLRLGNSRKAVAFARIANGRQRRALGINGRSSLKNLSKRLQQLAVVEKVLAWRAWPVGRRDQVENVFVCGLPRSGSTLLEQMFATMPGVQTVGESDEIQRFLSSIMNGSTAVNLPQPDPASRIVLNKLPDNIHFAEIIFRLLKRSKIVAIERDEAAVFLSNYMQYYTAGWEICYSDDALIRYVKHVRRISRLLAVKYPDRATVVSYERLVSNPVSEFRRLAALIGFELNDFNGTHKRDGVVLTASKMSVRGDIRKDTNEKYARVLEHMPFVRRRLGH